MIRLFSQHETRQQKELEGYWQFMPIQTWEIPEVFTEKMYVPGCWENDIAFRKYRGKAAYKKTLVINECGYYKLTFKGISHTAQVYLDGAMVGHHYNAYTAFDVVFNATSCRNYEIIVLVDNSFSEESTLHIPNDYYTYGGIFKPVVLEKINETFLEQLCFIPKKRGNSWQGELTVKLKKMQDESCEMALRFYLNEELVISQALQDIKLSSSGEWVYAYLFEFQNVIEWSPENPLLYLLKVQLVDQTTDKVVDDLIERVGFRQIEIHKNEIHLNGMKIFLQGFNRHEDFNVFGCSQPTQALAIDMSIVKDLHCNSIRTSHYPNDERFLDMCDELGIMVWEENHARGLSLEQMQKENFESQCENCITEMITNHMNHPAIIIWGILNECASDTKEGRVMYEKQFEQIKSLDKSRPLTFASCKHYTDLCLDLVDIVSFNLYFGWYDESQTIEDIKAEFAKELEWIKLAGGDNKPLIISEFGAGAIYGYRAPHEPKWSEERQANILRDTLTTYQNHPDVCGTYIWQFCDVRVTEEKWAMHRPRCLNNKGIVDEYRRPKLAYGVVKEIHGQRMKRGQSG